MSKEIRCAIYTRTSTDDRLNQELNSLIAQRLICEKYIKNQQGWITLPKRYEDGDKSGKNLNRPKVKELFRDIERGEIDCVVVYKCDRLSREVVDCAKIDNLFEKYNVAYVSVTEPFNNKTAVGKFIKTVLSGAGQYEREVTVARVRDKIAISKQNGLWMGGNPPLGYDVKEKKLIINREEAKVIKHIFERFIELKSIAALARELNRQGYRTKRFEARSGETYGGEIFKKATVRRIITNPIYTGKIRHHEKHYQGQHEGIIGEEKWNKVQALIASRPHRTAKYEEVLLKGVIRCQLCNVSMIPTYTVKKNKRYRYYECDNHLRGKHCPSINRSVTAGEAEREVEKQIRCILQNTQNILDEEVPRSLDKLNRMWKDLFPIKQEEIIKQLIKTTVVCENGINTCVSVEALKELCDVYGENAREGENATTSTITNIKVKNGEAFIFTPLKLKKKAGRCIILEPEDGHTKKDNTLLKALVRAHLWQRQLNEEKYANQKELSIANNMNPKGAYVRAVLHLNFLAPKIKEDILNGTQPRDLRWIDFRKKGIPLLWSEQLERFYG